MGKVSKKTPKKRITFYDLKLNRAVLEIRYPKGYLYWDVCGKCIHEINTISNEKIEFVKLSTDECILRFVEDTTAQAAFGFKHITLSATSLKNLNLFKSYTPLIFDVVKKNLNIKEISRVGFRLYYVLKTESHEEGKKFISELDLYSVSSDRFKGFGNELSITQPNIEASDEEGSVSIRISAVKRTDFDDPSSEFDEYAPRYAILMDIDFFKKNINVEEFDFERFIHSSEKKIKNHVGNILNK